MSASHVLSVVYDGPDLDEIAKILRVAPEGVVALHAGCDYQVETLGFLPGFAYLGPVDARLCLPRRLSPRPRVAAHSVGIAAGYTGVYPRASPGGWHLLGRMVGPPLFDPRASPPARLAVGDSVRFRAIAIGTASPADEFESAQVAASPRYPGAPLLVVRALGLATVQDGVRRHEQAAGVPVGGALDPDALVAANRALGNPVDAAAIELSRGVLTLRAHGRPLSVSANGAPAARLQDGEEATFRAGDAPLMIGVGGGVQVEVLLGSRSTCLPGAFGGYHGRALRSGDALPVGVDPGGACFSREVKPLDEVCLSVRRAEGSLVLPDAAWELLLASAFRASLRSDRVGTRLEGPPLVRRVAGELPPGPMVRGAIQVTHDGTPVILGPDHPVTGGYPVIGLVTAASRSLLGRLRAGGTVRFRASG